MLMVGGSLWSPPGCKTVPRTEPPKQQAQALMVPGATGPSCITVQLLVTTEAQSGLPAPLYYC